MIDPIMVLTPSLRVGTSSTTSTILPERQRDTPGQDRIFNLPAGVHQIQVLWRGDMPLKINLDESGIGTDWRVIGTVPGGANASPVLMPVVISADFGRVYFSANRPVVEADLAPGKVVTAGVTIFINQARGSGKAT